MRGDLRVASEPDRYEVAGLRLCRSMSVRWPGLATAHLGDNFIGGVALYTGERAYTYEDRLHVMPIDRLWTPSSAL
jgi:hypothetical protein